MNERKDMIIYDGQCISCNNFINHIIQHDNGRFNLLTQYSLSYSGIVGKYDFTFKPDQTIYLISAGKVYARSEAVRRILACCGGWNLLYSILLTLIPVFIRDLFYSFFAKHRYSAGKHQQCPIPSTHLLNRLI